jgi:acyl-homoserine lactone acylase PvdQ
MIQLQKTKEKVILSITTELDYEDVQDLVLDLQSWLIENNTEDHTKSEAYKEAKAQNHSKNKLAEDMRRCFVDLFDTQAFQNELTTYELDPKDRAIIVKKTKLKDERKKR